MIKKFCVFLALCGVILGANEQECQLYFEAKKAELAAQIKEFDEAKQALEAYRASFEALQKEKSDYLLNKEKELNATLAQIQSLKDENQRLLAQQEQILKSINEKTTGRIKEIYSQMKDVAIADVLSQMDNEEASKIMFSLEPRKISGVLSKMDPKKAGELTLVLKNFEDEAKDKNITSP
ncbi:MotE family protein [Campylobacter sp. US33a]|uniref:MotE family protein n=1 Tax=Campylobacter sp. US33a TaxID=2498120 RepID=UPI0010676C2B|nr:MotE family protein [Campylobacter sp. US33a]TEY04495.1 nucleosidase [Campylobacter sp. US33a]